MSVLAIELTPDLERRLESAARHSGMPVAEYARCLLELGASKPRRRPTAEDLRAAAEASREYYATDPEALELAEFAGDDPYE